MRGEDGGKEEISGEDLARLFDDAGGFMPQIVFLSACLSGAFVDIRSWADFQAAMLGRRTDGKQTPLPVLPDILDNPAGYTGAALALLRAGIPQVIAMRYEVGDMYARRLACEFYKRLLADPGAEQGNRTTDDALALARADLLKAPDAARLGAINHATPLMFGQAGRRLHPVSKRSKQLEKARPQPQPLLPGGSPELDAPRDFIGRARRRPDSGHGGHGQNRARGGGDSPLVQPLRLRLRVSGEIGTDTGRILSPNGFQVEQRQRDLS